MEGRLVSQAIARLAASDELSEALVKNIQLRVGWLEEIFGGLGFCLSEEPDLLSQWRGYAADGTGFSIGFKRQYLEQLGVESRIGNQSGFTLNRAVYSQEEHDQTVAPAYQDVKRLVESGAFKPQGRKGLLDSRSDEQIAQDNKSIHAATQSASLAIIGLFANLYLLKSIAFREEREWRLLSLLVNSGDDNCLYRCTGTQVIPYRSYSLLGIERQPIAEVLVGPKNPTPPAVVQGFLARCGYGKVDVRRSAATYR